MYKIIKEKIFKLDSLQILSNLLKDYYKKLFINDYKGIKKKSIFERIK